MSWHNVTVRQYISIKPIKIEIERLEALPKSAEVALDILEAKAEILSLMSGRSIDSFLNMSFEKLETAFKEFLKIEQKPLSKKLVEVVKVNGNKYTAFINPAKFNVHQWYAYLAYKGDIIENMPKMLTWIYRIDGFDYSKHEPSDYETDMLDMKIEDVSGCFFLLCKQWQTWQTKVSESNQKILKMTMEHLAEAEQWQKSRTFTDGIIQ